jgi:hypothetical protein
VKRPYARADEDVSLAVLIFATRRAVSSYLEVKIQTPGGSVTTPQLAELALTLGDTPRRFLAFVRRLHAGDPPVIARADLPVLFIAGQDSEFWPASRPRPVL